MNNQTFGEMFKEAREAAGLTPEELANEFGDPAKHYTGVSARQIHSVEMDTDDYYGLRFLTLGQIIIAGRAMDLADEQIARLLAQRMAEERLAEKYASRWVDAGFAIIELYDEENADE